MPANPRIESLNVARYVDHLIGYVVRQDAASALSDPEFITYHERDCVEIVFSSALVTAGAALHPFVQAQTVEILGIDISDVYDMNLRLLDLWEDFGCGHVDHYQAHVLAHIDALSELRNEWG